MPTYEYACPTCGIVEAFQSIKEPALTKCPNCKKAKVQRMISSGGGVIFKGSGFWETDYNRSGDYAKKQKADSADKSSDKSGQSDKSANKPPSKSTDKPITTAPAGGAGATPKNDGPQPKPAAMLKPLAPKGTRGA